MNYTDRVARGAAELDRILPGWERKIDLETLELQTGCRCVLGQLAVDLLGHPSDDPYEDASEHICPETGIDDQIAWEQERGFLLFVTHSPAAYTDLTEAWKRLIRERLEA